MILSRIKTAIHRQDWFAVILEFVIVILGIVIGLAVAEWVEQRQERVTERQLLERLHAEIIDLTSLQDAWLQTRSARLAQVQEARALVFYDNPQSGMLWEHCRAIVSSHVHPLVADTLPTLEDLVATGRLDFVANPELRAAIARFLIARDSSRNYAAMTRSLVHQLASRYPGLIRQGLRPSSDPDNRHGADRTYECDLAGMRVNDAFRNDFMENSERYADFTEFSVRAVNVRLHFLQDALEGELGI